MTNGNHTGVTTETRVPAKRAPWGSISRQRVVDAATRVIEAGGYKSMSIRSLAAELGVAPMSLYRHVRDKDDLLDEVVDRLLAAAWRPRVDPGDWMAWISDAAERLRHLLVSQPAALHVFLRHPVVTPAAVERMDAVMDVLRTGTESEFAARRAYAAIQTYTLGFAALEASRNGWTPGEDGADELALELAEYTKASQFSAGLRLLLEGVARESRGAA